MSLRVYKTQNEADPAATVVRSQGWRDAKAAAVLGDSWPLQFAASLYPHEDGEVRP